MPLIVPRADWQRWLEPGDSQRPPIDLLRAFPAEQMKAWEVSSAVNSVRNNGAELMVAAENPSTAQLFRESDPESPLS